MYMSSTWPNVETDAIDALCLQCRRGLTNDAPRHLACLLIKTIMRRTPSQVLRTADLKALPPIQLAVCSVSNGASLRLIRR